MNGDSRFFDKLMDALNTTGCVQARCEALLDVRIALDPEDRDVVDDTISTLPLVNGLGKVAQSLQKNQNDEVDYEAAVRLYVEKISRNGQPGVAPLGMDGTALGAKDTPVTLTVDYVMKPEIATVFKNVFGIFKD